MANTIQIKRGLATNLPTLSAGELAFTTDTKGVYIGDGTTATNFELAMVSYVDNSIVDNSASVADHTTRIVYLEASVSDLTTAVNAIDNTAWQASVHDNTSRIESNEASIVDHTSRIVYLEASVSDHTGRIETLEGSSGLTAWEESGSTLQPSGSGGLYDLGASANAIGDVYIDNLKTLRMGAPSKSFEIVNQTGDTTITTQGSLYMNAVKTGGFFNFSSNGNFQVRTGSPLSTAIAITDDSVPKLQIGGDLYLTDYRLIYFGSSQDTNMYFNSSTSRLEFDSNHADADGFEFKTYYGQFIVNSSFQGVYGGIHLRTNNKSAIDINATQIVTVSQHVVGPASTPKSDYQLANKQYVDNSAGVDSSASVANLNTRVVYLEASVSDNTTAINAVDEYTWAASVHDNTSRIGTNETDITNAEASIADHTGRIVYLEASVADHTTAINGMATLSNWEETATAFRPVVTDDDLGDSTHRIGTTYMKAAGGGANFGTYSYLAYVGADLNLRAWGGQLTFYTGGNIGMRIDTSRQCHFPQNAYFEKELYMQADDEIIWDGASGDAKMSYANAVALTIQTTSTDTIILKTNSTNALTVGTNQVVTFDEHPVGPASTPKTDYQLSNKKYVDDNAGADSSASVADHTTRIVYLEASVAGLTTAVNAVDEYTWAASVHDNTSRIDTAETDITNAEASIANHTGRIVYLEASVADINTAINSISALSNWHEDASGHLIPDTLTQDIGTNATPVRAIYMTASSLHVDSGIVISDTIFLPDEKQLVFGTDSDVSMKWNSSSSAFNIVTTVATNLEHLGFINYSTHASASVVVQNSGGGGLYIDQKNASGSIVLRTGASPSTALIIYSSQNAAFYGTVSIANDNDQLYIGAGADLQLYHDGTDSYVKNTEGDFYIAQHNAAGSIILQTGATPLTAMTIDVNQDVTFAGAIEMATGEEFKTAASGGLDMYSNASWGYIAANGTSGLNMVASGTSGMYFSAQNASSSILFRTGTSPTTAVTIDASQDVTFAGAAYFADYERTYWGSDSDSWISWDEATSLVGFQTASTANNEAILIRNNTSHAGGSVTIANQGGGSIYLSQHNAAGSIFLQTGATPTTRLSIDASGNCVFGELVNFLNNTTYNDSCYVYVGSDNDAFIAYESSIFKLHVEATADVKYIELYNKSTHAAASIHIENLGENSIWIDQTNATGLIYMRTGASPTNALSISAAQQVYIYDSMLFPDNAELYFGSDGGSDSVITHSGSALTIENYTGFFYISNSASGGLYLQSKAASSSVYIQTGATPSTAVEIDHNQDTSFIGEVNFGGHLNIIDNPVADHTVKGIISEMTVDVNAYGQFATLFVAADGNLETSDANTSTDFPIIALAIDTGTGADKKVVLSGFARDDTWTWTVGGVIYASETEGAMTQTAPTTSGATVQVLGVATHATRMYFNPSMDLIVVT